MVGASSAPRYFVAAGITSCPVAASPSGDAGSVVTAQIVAPSADARSATRTVPPVVPDPEHRDHHVGAADRGRGALADDGYRQAEMHQPHRGRLGHEPGSALTGDEDPLRSDQRIPQVADLAPVDSGCPTPRISPRTVSN